MSYDIDQINQVTHVSKEDKYNLPEDSASYKNIKVAKIHAKKNKAKLYFAGVGFANSENYNLPLLKNNSYVLQKEYVGINSFPYAFSTVGWIYERKLSIGMS